jgi:serine/threonine protein kinase
VERVIGMGGFGITYAASHVSLGTKFAIKEFYIEGKCMRLADNVTVTYQDMEPGAFEKFRKRFHDEAITLCQLDNSHVVHVHDIFDENGTTYILMDFVVGETLQKKVEREGALPYDLAVNYMAQLCEAVEHIHSHHILHRDIKPDNIIITPSNNVVLIDFGSARSFVHDQEQKHTAMLTVGYAPIEQYTATSKKGNYTDLYAVGATFYFILTGKKPLPAAERVIQDELQTPSDLNPQVTDAVSRTIMKALNLKPEDRYQTVEDFQRDLLGYAPGSEQKTVVNEGSTNSVSQDSDTDSTSSLAFVAAWIIILILCLVVFVAYVSTTNHSDQNEPSGYQEYEYIEEDHTNPYAEEEAQEDESQEEVSGSESEYAEYVDLGLPSGTLWKDENEHGGIQDLFTNEEATLRFCNQLPTKEQLDELMNRCQWIWYGNGYRVVGPNGASLVMPVTGYYENGGNIKGRTHGNYWSRSDGKNSSVAYKLYFTRKKQEVCTRYKTDGHAVRLVRY